MEKLLIIDSNSILNRAFNGIRYLSTKDMTPTNAIYGFLNILLKLIEEEKPDYVLAAFDLKAPTFRHKMYDDLSPSEIRRLQGHEKAHARGACGANADCKGYSLGNEYKNFRESRL